MKPGLRAMFERRLARYSRSPFPVSVAVAHLDADGHHIRGWGLPLAASFAERRVLSTHERFAVYVARTMTLREAGVVRRRP